CWHLCALRCDAHAFGSPSRSPAAPSRPDAPIRTRLQYLHSTLLTRRQPRSENAVSGGSLMMERTRLTAGERRAAILAAAKGVFGGVGYHEATTRDIAAAAGVSEALLYQHFPGKRQLFMELVLTAATELENRLRTAAGAPDPAAA